MGCGCNGGSQRVITRRNKRSGSTQRRSAQSETVAYSGFKHGGYRLQITPQSDDGGLQEDKDSKQKHAK